MQANGHIENEIASVDSRQSYLQAGQLFWNGGEQGLVPLEPSATGDLAREIVGRGAAYADLDGDSDLDVTLTQIAGRRSYCATIKRPATTGCAFCSEARHLIATRCAWIELSADGVV